MRLPPAVIVEFTPSRTLGVAIGLMTFATLVVLLTLPLPAWQHCALVVTLLAWAVRAFRRHALRRGSPACTGLRLAPNRLVAVRTGDGRLTAGHVRSSTFVAPWLTTVVWRPDGARWSRSILIVPDMLPAEDFRRLRVMLRYARSGDVEAAPASQA